jgi:alkylation response protein AidB-like acyl-CoA dehydrogenase
MILELTPAQDAFRQSVDAFAREMVAPRAGTIDESGEFPADIIKAAAGRGLCGVTTPHAWGGLGLDYLSYVLAIEALARASASVAASLSVTNSLVADIITHAGSASQKDRWLRPLAAGTIIGAFALSEPDAGTDAGNQQTTATRSPGTSADRYRLAGRKVWVANGEVASMAIVFAATRPGNRGHGITAFIVPLDGPGVTRTARTDALGVRGLGCLDLQFDVDVGGDQIVGRVDEGFALAMWALQGGCLAVAAQALGIGRAALDEAIAHATHRQTFGQTLASYQAIQWMIADAATTLEAARLLTFKAAANKPVLTRDPSGPPDRPDPRDLPGLPDPPGLALEASMAKLAASQGAHVAADVAMQILASAGYRRGSAADRFVRDARATEFQLGPSEMQRMIIAAGVLGPLDGADWR